MSQPSDDRLDSWKEIAAYLGRDVRTLRRWEEERHLPIHRVPGGGRRAVFAFRGEIQSWLGKAGGKPDEEGASLNREPVREDQGPPDAILRGAGHEIASTENEAHPGSDHFRPSLDGKRLNPLHSQRFAATRNLRLTVLVAIVSTIGAIAAALTLRSHFSNPEGTAEAQSTVSVDSEKVPAIFSVTPIAPQARQRIVIQGRGFGLHVPYSRTDSPYLAIRNMTGKWAAGRMIPWNWDEVMLDVESWSDTQIVVSGFSGSYGTNGWKLNFADELEIAVWNPQSGVGPGLYHTAVVSTEARR